MTGWLTRLSNRCRVSESLLCHHLFQHSHQKGSANNENEVRTLKYSMTPTEFTNVFVEDSKPQGFMSEIS